MGHYERFALKLRYLIGKDADPGTDDSITVIGYDATTPPKNGVKYCNLLDEKNTGKYGPHIHSETGDEYNEPAPDPERKGFWDNVREQLDRAKADGFTSLEWDNCDTYTASVVLLVYNETASHGFTIWAKNPAIVSGNREAILAHSAVVGVIVEKDCGSPSTYDAMRKAAGKPDLPIRFVSYGNGKQWAQQTAGTIQAGAYRNMSVTYSSEGEYGNAVDVPLPIGNPMPEAAPWLADARSDIGRYHDGPDVPKLAQEVAKAFPDVIGLASYCALAKSDTPWCGIFVAAKLARYGIKPPFDRTNELRSFMWVDSWLDFGQKVTVGQEQPGDLALYLSNPHHITFVAGNGRYIGGNQGDGVTEGSYRRPDAIRRPVAVAAEKPPPKPMSNRFKVCYARVLKHEGGNDNDPRDPGGRTSRGITAERWAEWRKTHPGLPADVWEAPQSEVEAIYLEKYWQPLWCDMLPVGVDYAVFDFGVNSGPSRSAKFLQEIVGSEVDGEVGPNTVAATKAMAAADGDGVINALCDNRLFFLKGLSTWGTFGRGWTTRVEDVRRDAIMDWQTIKDVVQEPDESEEPDDQPQSIPAVEAALKDIVAALRPILEKHIKKEPEPVTQSNFDWGKLLQPLLAELAPKIIPLLMPYVAQMLPQLLPYLLDAMFKPRQSIMSKPGVQMGGSALGGGLLVAIADHFLNK